MNFKEVSKEYLNEELLEKEEFFIDRLASIFIEQVCGSTGDSEMPASYSKDP